jgi:hypothetical protein
VTYDPTPPERRAAAWAAAKADPDGGIGTWFSELRESLVFWATTGGHVAYLQSFLDTLRDGPRALCSTLRRQPGWVALALALVLILGSRRRSRRGRVGRALAPGPLPFRDDLQRLLAALAARGFARRPSQTLGELARETAARGGEAYARLPALARALERGRYGTPPLSAAESAALLAFVRELPTGGDPAR